MGLGEDGAHDGNDGGGVGEMFQSEYPFQLLEAHHRRCPSHEPYYCCMWQEIHHESQPTLQSNFIIASIMIIDTSFSFN